MQIWSVEARLCALGAGAPPGVQEELLQVCCTLIYRKYLSSQQADVTAAAVDSYSTSNFKKHFSETPCALI